MFVYVWPLILLSDGGLFFVNKEINSSLVFWRCLLYVFLHSNIMELDGTFQKVQVLGKFRNPTWSFKIILSLLQGLDVGRLQHICFICHTTLGRQRCDMTQTQPWLSQRLHFSGDKSILSVGALPTHLSQGSPIYLYLIGNSKHNTCSYKILNIIWPVWLIGLVYSALTSDNPSWTCSQIYINSLD